MSENFMIDMHSEGHEKVARKTDSSSSAVMPGSAAVWFNVNDKLPDVGVYCLVCAGDVQFMACAYDGSDFVWADGYAYGESQFDPLPSELVTHWTPLPVKP